MIIPIHTSPRKPSKAKRLGTNLDNLVPIQTLNRNIPYILNANVQSINHKIDELNVVLEHWGIHCAVITETWWHETTYNQNDSGELFSRYLCLRNEREGRQGGGVAVMIQQDIKYHEWKEL